MTEHHSRVAPKSLVEAVEALLDKWMSLPASDRTTDSYSKRQAALDALFHQLSQLRGAYDAYTGKDGPIRQGYSREKQKGVGRDSETVERHESYGMVQLTRNHGGGRLFGSQIEGGASFHFVISRGERKTSSWGESFRHQSDGPDLIDFSMSPAQFVELIGAIGMGGGVPCTLRRIQGVPMDPVPPDAGSEMETAHDELRDEMQVVIKQVRGLETELEGTFSKLTKKDREAAMATVVKLRRFVDDSLPFAAQLFGEHREKAVAKGKAEIDAFIGLALRHAGIKSIADAGGRLVLGSGTEKDE